MGPAGQPPSDCGSSEEPRPTRMEHGMHSKTNSDDGVPRKKYIS
jgi:hypothetical protein